MAKIILQYTNVSGSRGPVNMWRTLPLPVVKTKSQKVVAEPQEREITVQ